MKLTVFNGSPRRKGSNTRVVLEEFLAGFESVSGNSHNLEYLKDVNEHDRYVEMFRQAEIVFIAFPLYVDAMPAIVKAFIERLSPLVADQDSRKPSVLYLVQSGFPEASHSRRVELYLEKLTQRLGCQYLGTIVKGGVEGIKVKPAWMVKGLKQVLRELGESFGRSGVLDAGLLIKLSKPERLSTSGKLLLRFISIFGITNMYWNMMLKKHNAFDKHLAKPYQREGNCGTSE